MHSGLIKNNLITNMALEIDTYGIDASLFSLFLTTLETNLDVISDEIAEFLKSIESTKAPKRHIVIERIKKTASFIELKNANHSAMHHHIHLKSMIEKIPKSNAKKKYLISQLGKIRNNIKNRVREMIQLEKKIAELDKKMPEFHHVLHLTNLEEYKA